MVQVTLDINTLLPEIKPIFWTVVQECQWDGDVDATRQRLHRSLMKHDLALIEFSRPFLLIKDVINQETDRRINNNEESFEHDIHRGGDGKHFSDLPGELISRGPDAVNDYLNKLLFDEEARECFEYVIK